MPDQSESGDVGYVRDRSFYDSRPNESRTPKIHRASVTRTGMAACDATWILLDMESPIALRDDAEQKTRLCLRCFPVGQRVRSSPVERTDGG